MAEFTYGIPLCISKKLLNIVLYLIEIMSSDWLKYVYRIINNISGHPLLTVVSLLSV